MRYVIATLPRSGSFLASQLIEEYLVRKYKYKRLPFYEYLCYTTTEREEGTVECSIENDEITFSCTDNKLDSANEIAKRMTLLNYQSQQGITYLNKLVWPSSPDYTFQHYAKQGYAFIYIERDDVLAQIASFIVAVKSKTWHNTTSDMNHLNPGTTNKLKDIGDTFEIGRELVDRQLMYLAQMRNISNWTNSRTVHYEDFANDYDRLFHDLEFNDYKKYLPDYDFVQSKPSTNISDPKKIIKNYDEALGWVDEISNELLSHTHRLNYQVNVENRTIIT